MYLVYHSARYAVFERRIWYGPSAKKTVQGTLYAPTRLSAVLFTGKWYSLESLRMMKTRRPL